jgi:heme-degrading monooxygenase HmoA
MGRREEGAARVGEHEFLRPEVGDPEHEHVVEAFAALVDRIPAPAPVAAEELPVDEVGRPAVAGVGPGRLRHGEGELVEVGHRRHPATLPGGCGTSRSTFSHVTRVIRVWTGQGSPEGVDRYCREHFATAVLPRLRSIEGFVSARLLVRPLGGEPTSEVVVATVWDSMESIDRFAGADRDRAVVESVVRELLDRFDERVTHFTVALDTSDESV